MRSGADLCWGQRRLDSSLPKSDSLSYSHALCVCLCVCCRLSVHARMYKLFQTVQVSGVVPVDVKMCLSLHHLTLAQSNSISIQMEKWKAKFGVANYEVELVIPA